jgi:hypothetical protein
MPKDNLVKVPVLFSMLFWVTCSFAFTDYNGDGKADIAFYLPGSTGNLVPVLFGNGDGSWNPTNFPGADWVNQPGVIAVPGDFNGDGKTDIAFYRPGSGWNTVPVLFSNSDGSWRATNFPAPAWANQPGVIAVPGDFNGDGKTDIAFYRPGGGWNTVPVLFSNGDGTWRDTNLSAPDWANKPGVIAMPGHYRGCDTTPSLIPCVTDIAFYNPGSTWNTVPVLFSNGDGSWNSTNLPAPDWVNESGVIAVPGQYRCRPRGQLCFGFQFTDIAFYNPGSNWNNLRILFARGDGNWDSDTSVQQDWINEPGVLAVPGNYVGNGLTGIAFHRPGSSWNTVPMVLRFWDFRDIPLREWWGAYNNPAPDWANQPGVLAVPGDYGDGRAGIAFYNPGSTWNSVPVLFSNGDGTWGSTNFQVPGWANQPEVIAVQSTYAYGVQLPPLSFNPSSVTVTQGGAQQVVVAVPNATTSRATVYLNPANANISVAGVAPGTQAAAIIPQGATTSPAINIQGLAVGSSSVTASGTRFQSGVLNVAIVLPSLSFSPPNVTVMAGSSQVVNVTIPNAASSPVDVNLNPANANISVSPTMVIIPQGSNISFGARMQGLRAGGSSVTAAAMGFQSAVLNVTVLARPTPTQLVFRSTDSEVESFDFSDPAHPAEIDHQPATPAGVPSPPGCRPQDCTGPASPSLALDTAGHLLRTTIGDVQVFNVTADGHLTLLAGLSVQPSFTSLALAANGTTIFRAIDVGLQSLQLNGSLLGSPSLVNGTVSAANVGLDVFGTIAVRAHPTGIDVFNVTNPANMRLLGIGTGTVSLTGVDAKIFARGTRAIRAGSSGIEVYDLSQPAAPQLMGANNTGTPSFGQVAIVVDVGGARAVRITNNGIEVYDLTAVGFPRIDNCTPNNGNCGSTASTTGVAAAISGNTVFRGLTAGAEAFDITNPRAPVRLGSIPATSAFAGVGLTGR